MVVIIIIELFLSLLEVRCTGSRRFGHNFSSVFTLFWPLSTF